MYVTWLSWERKDRVTEDVGLWPQQKRGNDAIAKCSNVALAVLPDWECWSNGNGGGGVRHQCA